MERGDIVVTNKKYYKHGKSLVAIVLNLPAKGADVTWLGPVPPSEDFRHIHPKFDRHIDELEWLDIVGHIDLPPEQG